MCKIGDNVGCKIKKRNCLAFGASSTEVRFCGGFSLTHHMTERCSTQTPLQGIVTRTQTA